MVRAIDGGGCSCLHAADQDPACREASAQRMGHIFYPRALKNKNPGFGEHTADSVPAANTFLCSLVGGFALVLRKGRNFALGPGLPWLIKVTRRVFCASSSPCPGDPSGCSYLCSSSSWKCLHPFLGP